MRIIYDKKTKVITGIIAERVTSFIPPSYVGEGSTYIDIDYDQKSLKRSRLTQTLEKEGSNLIGKTININAQRITFVDKREKQYMDTVLVDIDSPLLHKDVEIYSKKGLDKGAKVEIDDIDSVILAKIKDGDRLLGSIRLEKKGCCTYVYHEGIVEDREFYPHYVGFQYLLNYLKGKAKWLDMGGLLKKDDDLNRFKRKWGKNVLVEVDRQ